MRMNYALTSKHSSTAGSSQVCSQVRTEQPRSLLRPRDPPTALHIFKGESPHGRAWQSEPLHSRVIGFLP
jgi:hypothetical protein